jgi:hypothetical protein
LMQSRSPCMQFLSTDISACRLTCMWPNSKARSIDRHRACVLVLIQKEMIVLRTYVYTEGCRR